MHLPALGHCAPAPLGNGAEPEKILKTPWTVGLGIDNRPGRPGPPRRQGRTSAREQNQETNVIKAAPAP